MDPSSTGSEPPSHFSSVPPSQSEEEISPDKGDIVVKANQLIRGRINWTKLEHRVVAMLVAQLKQEDDAFEMQRVHVSDLMDMAQISSRDIYDRAEEVCRKLLNQKVHVRTSTQDGRRVYQGYNCLSTCRYIEGSGYIEAKFNDDMKPFLLQLKRQFTMYRLQNFMQLSSQHSMRVYELIKMKEGLRYLCISVEELREVLCCEHTYDRFSDFKRYVLERARTEIADTCDTYFTYKVERDGRTPVRVHLLVHQPDDPRTDPVLIWRKGEKSGRSAPDASQSRTSKGKSSKKGRSSNRRPGGPNSAKPGPDRTSADGCSSGPSSSSSGSLENDHGNSAKVAEAPSPSSTFNLYSTVLSGLTQDELDQVSEETVRSAISAARQEESISHPESASATEAWAVAWSALEELRGGGSESPKGKNSEGGVSKANGYLEDDSSETCPPETEPTEASLNPPTEIT